MTQPPDWLLEYGKQRAAFWENPTRGRCTHADHTELPGEDQDNLIIQDGLCAPCARVVAFSKPKAEFSYPCDNCGNDGAFRDPLHRKDEYLCEACHRRTGYSPGERAMVSQIEVRQGFRHSQGRKETCIAAGRGTECKGQVKPRGKNGVMCDFHNNPRLFK